MHYDYDAGVSIEDAGDCDKAVMEVFHDVQ